MTAPFPHLVWHTKRFTTSIHDRSLSSLGMTHKKIYNIDTWPLTFLTWYDTQKDLQHRYMTAHFPHLVWHTKRFTTSIHDRSLSSLGMTHKKIYNIDTWPLTFLTWYDTQKDLQHRYMTAHFPHLVWHTKRFTTSIHDRSLSSLSMTHKKTATAK